MLFEVFVFSSGLICKPIKFWENCAHRKWILSSTGAERFFLEFSQKEAVFGRTNYGSFSFSLGPIYGRNMSEIDFST